MSRDSVNASVGLLRALADPVRPRLLNLLGACDGVCVHHLHEALELPQLTVSRHLAYLRKHGLVISRKEGLWVHYRLAKATGRNYLTCDSVILGLMVMSYFGRVAERCRRASYGFISLATTRTPSG